MGSSSIGRHRGCEDIIWKGCQENTKLLLRGKGIQYLNGRPNDKGSQIVHLKIQIPKTITARQEELLREFDEETKNCGGGISGRLAAAAGSAFDTFFGGGSKKETASNKDKKVKENEMNKDDDDDDDLHEKKQQAS